MTTSDDLTARVFAVLREGQPFSESVDRVIEVIAGGQGWLAGALWMRDHHEHSMIGAGAWAAGADQAPFAAQTRHLALPIADSEIGRCWRSGETLWVDDIEAHAGFSRQDLLLSCGLRSAALMPIRSLGGDEILGVLELLGDGDAYSRWRGVMLAEGILRELSGFLKSRIEGERARIQAARFDVALDAASMGVWEWDRRTDHVYWSTRTEQIHGYQPGTFPGTLDAYRDRVHPDDAESNRAALEATLESGSDHHVLHRILTLDGEERWVESHGRLIGDEFDGFTGLTGVITDVTERERLLADLAEQVRRTELALADRTQLAELLQRSLFPDRLPAADGLDLASGYRPGEELVGGDFFDVFSAAESTFVCIGDVCGHGTEAAVLTSLARHALRGLIAAGIDDPVELLNRVNDVIRAEELDHQYISMVLGRLEVVPAGVRVELCRAGHPLPLLRRGDVVERIGDSAGGVLGVIDDPALSSEVFEMAPGDALVLYTDGIIEARRGDDFFGEERLRAGVADAKGSAQAIVDEVLGRLDRYRSGSLADDVAMLVAVVDESISS